MFNFEKLDTWHEAIAFADLVYKLSVTKARDAGWLQTGDAMTLTEEPVEPILPQGGIPGQLAALNVGHVGPRAFGCHADAVKSAIIHVTP